MIGLRPAASSKQPLTVLFLGAHCDDIEIGCGATVVKLAATAPTARVVWIVFGADESHRETEARNSAADFLSGLPDHRIELHGFRNAYFPDAVAAIKDRFELIKQDVSPDLVFTHDRDDRHQDHRVIAELTWNTFRNHTILEYEIPKYDGGLRDPNMFVAVSEDQINRKIELLMRHFGSQSNKHWFTADLFAGLMRLRGIESASATGFAEGFYCRKAALEFPPNL